MSRSVSLQDLAVAAKALGVTAQPSSDAMPCRTIRRGKDRPRIETKSPFIEISILSRHLFGYSITSSARPSNVSENASPRVFDVLRFDRKVYSIHAASWCPQELGAISLAGQVDTLEGPQSKRCLLWVKSGHLRAKSHVRFTPESRHVRCTSRCPLGANSEHWPSLLDHFVGAGKQYRRHRDTKRPCSGDIDDEIELRWLLDWDIGWFRST